MKITARPVSGKPGTVEVLIDGQVCSSISCRPGSARISKGQIELLAMITCSPEADKEVRKNVKREAKDENIG